MRINNAYDSFLIKDYLSVTLLKIEKRFDIIDSIF